MTSVSLGRGQIALRVILAVLVMAKPVEIYAAAAARGSVDTRPWLCQRTEGRCLTWESQNMTERPSYILFITDQQRYDNLGATVIRCCARQHRRHRRCGGEL